MKSHIFITLAKGDHFLGHKVAKRLRALGMAQFLGIGKVDRHIAAAQFRQDLHKLRKVLLDMYKVLDSLKLTVHPDKRYIGTTKRGFDFLGYRLHPGRKLRASRQSLDRLLQRARQLYEQGADENRLRQYVQRWYAWLHGGLPGLVSIYGRFTRIWIYVLTHITRTGRPLTLS